MMTIEEYSTGKEDEKSIIIEENPADTILNEENPCDNYIKR